MNKKNTMRPINKTNSHQSIFFDEVYQKISDIATDTENVSKEKYTVKERLIESANDMSTQEKLDAMDKNYDRRNQERWQNLLYFAVISFSVVGIAISSPLTAKNIRRLLTVA